MSELKVTKDDVDHPWKLILTVFFDLCIGFIKPELYAMIDWNRPVEFLEQELYEIIKTRFRGAKICDKLAKVWLLDGKPCWILVHAEVESNPKKDFPRRFYWYRVLIADKHKTDNIFSLAIYTGPKSKWQVNQYSFRFMENEISFRFPVFKVWEQNKDDLINSENPFALLVLAQQFANETRQDMDQRLTFRQKLFELATERKISKRVIWHLLIFVKYLTSLPEKQEAIYTAYTQKKLHQNQNNMGVTLDDIKWLDSLMEVSTGDSIFKQLEEFQKEIELTRQQAIASEKKAVMAKQEAKKAEQEAKKAEQEAKKAEQEAKKAEQEAKKAEQETRQFHATILKCYRERQWSIQEIAVFFSLPVSRVEAILHQKGE